MSTLAGIKHRKNTTSVSFPKVRPRAEQKSAGRREFSGTPHQNVSTILPEEVDPAPAEALRLCERQGVQKVSARRQTFLGKLRAASCMPEMEYAIIYPLLFARFEKQLLKDGMILENEPPRWNPRNRKPLIFLGFFRSSDASSPLYLSCLSLRFPAGFWRRFQAKSYMESCPSGRRCSTRNAVKSNLPRVRIPNSPPAKPYRSRSARLFSLSLER